MTCKILTRQILGCVAAVSLLAARTAVALPIPSVYPPRAQTGVYPSGAGAVGSVLSCSTSASNATYQWIAGSTPTNGAAISGATSSTYTVQQAQSGQYVGCVATMVTSLAVTGPATAPAPAGLVFVTPSNSGLIAALR